MSKGIIVCGNNSMWKYISGKYLHLENGLE